MFLNHSLQVDILLRDAAMKDFNAVNALFPVDVKCHPPTSNDVTYLKFQKDYQIGFEHLHYLTDSAIPYLAYATSVLGAALYCPT